MYTQAIHVGIQLTTTTTENHHLHLQCNGTGLHQDTKLRLYGPEQEYQCLRLTEDTGSHVVCQHTIASPNQTHSGHYYCQVDPSTCDALKSENVYVHVQTSVTVSINDITTDDTISYVSTRTVSNDDVIVSTSTETRYKIITIAVAGIGSTFLVLIASFILGCYLRTRQEMKANRNNERGQQRPGT